MASTSTAPPGARELGVCDQHGNAAEHEQMNLPLVAEELGSRWKPVAPPCLAGVPPDLARLDVRDGAEVRQVADPVERYGSC